MNSDSTTQAADFSAQPADDFVNLLAAEKFAFAIARIENAVAEEDKHVSGLHAKGELVVFGFVEQAERKAGRFNRLILAVVDVNRPRKAGVGDGQRSLLIVPHCINDRNELRLDTALGKRKIYRRKHLRRSRLDGSMRAQNPADQSGINCRRRAFSADVADDDAEPRHANRE